MKFDLRSPCGNCPFRTDIPGFLREARVREIVDMLLRQDGSFSCHKTVDYAGEDEGEAGATTDTQFCAGAMIFCEKQEHPVQIMRVAERLHLYDYRKLKMDAPVFGDAESMAEHHRDAWGS